MTRGICWYGSRQHWSNFLIWPLYKLSCDPHVSCTGCDPAAIWNGDPWTHTNIMKLSNLLFLFSWVNFRSDRPIMWHIWHCDYLPFTTIRCYLIDYPPYKLNNVNSPSLQGISWRFLTKISNIFPLLLTRSRKVSVTTFFSFHITKWPPLHSFNYVPIETHQIKKKATK